MTKKGWNGSFLYNNDAVLFIREIGEGKLWKFLMLALNLNIYGKILSVSDLTLRRVKLIIGKFFFFFFLHWLFAWLYDVD